MFSTSNLQISIHFLLPLLMSHGHEMLALWLTLHETSTDITVSFYVSKKSYQEEETSKTDDVVNKPGTFEIRKYASFTTITKAQLLSFDSWNMRHPFMRYPLSICVIREYRWATPGCNGSSNCWGGEYLLQIDTIFIIKDRRCPSRSDYNFHKLLFLFKVSSIVHTKQSSGFPDFYLSIVLVFFESYMKDREY